MDAPSIQKQKQIQILSQDNSNTLLPLSTIPIIRPEYKQFILVTKGTFYPYNQTYDDFGWGCAWRAIQTLLSNYEKETDFKDLVMKYRRKDVLWSILENQSGKQNQLKNLNWAPEETQNCWAQPFIGRIICKGLGLKSKLKLVNGYPKAYAPEIVFDEKISFAKFWEMVKQYIPHTPIMIDDSLLALSIIGYKQGINNQKHLLLADPHITTNRAKDKQTVGIYSVVLNAQGQQLRNDVVQDVKDLYPFNSFSKIYFKEKNWMVLGVQAQKILSS